MKHTHFESCGSERDWDLDVFVYLTTLRARSLIILHPISHEKAPGVSYKPGGG